MERQRLNLLHENVGLCLLVSYLLFFNLTYSTTHKWYRENLRLWLDTSWDLGWLDWCCEGPLLCHFLLLSSFCSLIHDTVLASHLPSAHLELIAEDFPSSLNSGKGCYCPLFVNIGILKQNSLQPYFKCS